MSSPATLPTRIHLESFNPEERFSIVSVFENGRTKILGDFKGPVAFDVDPAGEPLHFHARIVEPETSINIYDFCIFFDVSKAHRNPSWTFQMGFRPKEARMPSVLACPENLDQTILAGKVNHQITCEHPEKTVRGMSHLFYTATFRV